MNKKILLIENRPGRQNQYLVDAEKQLSALSDFLECKSYKDQLISIDKGELNFLNEFDLVMAHRSALGELSNGNKTNAVVDHCKKNKKDLILFSGGIASSIYTEEGGKLLLIPSEKFYTEHLIPFLKDYHIGNADSLLELQYGKGWKLSYLLQLREYLTLEKVGENYSEKIDTIKELLGINETGDLNADIENLIKSV